MYQLFDFSKNNFFFHQCSDDKSRETKHTHTHTTQTHQNQGSLARFLWQPNVVKFRDPAKHSPEAAAVGERIEEN